MNKRPLPVTLIGWLFVLTGSIGIVYHTIEFTTQAGPHPDVVLILLTHLLAIVGGVFLLRGTNWARWLLVLWMGYHVILSAMHELMQLAIHIVLLLAIAYFLFWSKSKLYFRAESTDPENI